MLGAQVQFKAKGHRGQLIDWSRPARRSSSVTPGIAVGTTAAIMAVYAVAVFPTIQVMHRSGANVSEAKLAIQLARNTNAMGNLILQEAIDKARVIKTSAQADVAQAAIVKAIELTKAGATTSAQITPAISAVTVQYTVSGTDGYYASGTLQTTADGRVEFLIPRARSGVEDTISVSAVLSGRSARTLFIW